MKKNQKTETKKVGKEWQQAADDLKKGKYVEAKPHYGFAGNLVIGSAFIATLITITLGSIALALIALGNIIKIAVFITATIFAAVLIAAIAEAGKELRQLINQRR